MTFKTHFEFYAAVRHVSATAPAPSAAWQIMIVGLKPVFAS
jgi:hypothetical protein